MRPAVSLVRNGARSRPSVDSRTNYAGPIGDHRYYCEESWAIGDHWPNIIPVTLGPLEAIGTTTARNPGPIGDRRPNIIPVTLGPLETIGITTARNPGPIGDHRPNFTPVILGPSETISGVISQLYRAHWRSSAKYYTGNAGPIGDHRYYNCEESWGPLEIIGPKFHR